MTIKYVMQCVLEKLTKSKHDFTRITQRNEENVGQHVVVNKYFDEESVFKMFMDKMALGRNPQGKLITINK